MTGARYLNFHGIGEPRRALELGERELWVDPARFEGIVRAVAARGEVHLTFDDANVSDHEVALPVLGEYGLHASFFILTGRLDRAGSLSSTQVQELAAAGMSIGTHGMNHVSWRSLEPGLREDEFVTARKILEDLVQRPVRAASMPFGQYDARTLRDLGEARYERVMTSDGYWRFAGSGVVPRRTVRHDDTVQGIIQLVQEPPRLTARAIGAAKQFVKARR